MINPKYEKHLRDRIRDADVSKSPSRYGIIMSYDAATNTATVLLSAPDGTDSLGDLIPNVPCPVTLGIQSVSPEPGRPCWVIFKGERDSSPMITHYFNHVYNKFDYKRQTVVKSTTPNFIINM